MTILSQCRIRIRDSDPACPYRMFRTADCPLRGELDDKSEAISSAPGPGAGEPSKFDIMRARA